MSILRWSNTTLSVADHQRISVMSSPLPFAPDFAQLTVTTRPCPVLGLHVRYGPCSFRVVEPRIWNVLSSRIKDINISRKQLESGLFVQAYSYIASWETPRGTRFKRRHIRHTKLDWLIDWLITYLRVKHRLVENCSGSRRRFKVNMGFKRCMIVSN